MPTIARFSWDPQERPRFTGPVDRYVPHHATLKDPDTAALDGTYVKARGGRWNPPASFPVLYTSCTEAVAIANLRYKHRGLSFQPWELAEEQQPDLYAVDVDQARLVDAGLAGIGLPPTYPAKIGHDITQPIGAQLHGERYAGVWCRSAADLTGEEIALFLDRATSPVVAGQPRRLAEWFPVPDGDESV